MAVNAGWPREAKRLAMMQPEQFDELRASLDVADDAPRLVAAAREPSVVTRG